MKAENVQRVTHVIRVLAKHGLGGILSRYGFAWYMPIFKRGGKIPADLPQRLRAAMEELGGAYVKLGQLLSVRPDLVPQEYCDEFSKLLDTVPPEEILAVEGVITEEFKKPVHEVFTHLDPRPLGSASVAQVHKARLKSGKAVAVKVQRPGIAQKFASDIDIIRYIAHKLQKHLQNQLDLALIVDEFERYTKKELNFTVEASHIEDVRTSVKSRNVVIPRVFWTHTTSKVLTMEYLEGIKLSEMEKADKPNAAKLLADAYIDQVFRHGTFHADLHPGNILILKNNKIGLLDFGIVGHLSTQTRKLGLQLYVAILDKDTKQISETLIKYGTLTSKTDVDQFVRAVTTLVNDWWDNNPEKRRVTHLMNNLFVLCTQHGIIMPTDTILLGKGLITLEGTARQLDPNFDFVSYSQPKIAQLLKQQRTPGKIVERFTKRSREFAEAVSELPSKTLEAVSRIEERGLSIDLKDEEFRHIGKDLNLSSNRLSYSMISAALILAGALMIDVGPKVGTYSVISLLSLSVASVFVMALFISVAREHKPKWDPHS